MNVSWPPIHSGRSIGRGGGVSRSAPAAEDAWLVMVELCVELRLTRWPLRSWLEKGEFHRC